MARNKIAVMTVLVVAVIGLAGPALAHGGSGERPPEPRIVHRQPHPKTPHPPRVAGGGHVLPFTGSDLTLFVCAAGLTIGMGAGLIRRARSLELRP